MKEAYQQAVMESESSSNLRKNLSEKIEACDTKSIKERFEKGEVANEKTNKENRNEEEEVYESGKLLCLIYKSFLLNIFMYLQKSARNRDPCS